ncbi:MAG: hypothetical protein GX892_12125 [Thermoanaerobacteraceae bacterium]|nr:hypothetical protein [Thermoanaerobacteraceae bacterium]
MWIEVTKVAIPRILLFNDLPRLTRRSSMYSDYSFIIGAVAIILSLSRSLKSFG